jgi:hypothetical protein
MLATVFITTLTMTSINAPAQAPRIDAEDARIARSAGLLGLLDASRASTVAVFSSVNVAPALEAAAAHLEARSWTASVSSARATEVDRTPVKLGSLARSGVANIQLADRR